MIFSIIIPVYNVAPYLRGCLDSVLAQSCADWEAICVDDGSMDGSGLILDEYAALDKRIKVWHRLNGGVCRARNFALDCARGEYVVFVDADDYIFPGCLKTIAGLATKFRCDAVRFRFRNFTKENFSAVEDDERSASLISGRPAVQSRLVGAVLKDGYVFMNSFRRRILKNVYFAPDTRVMEDCIFCAAAYLRVESVVLSDYVGYGYRQRGDSAVHKRPEGISSIDDLKGLFAALVSWWKENSGWIEGRSLNDVKRVIAEFVYKQLLMQGIANRKSLRNPSAAYGELASMLERLHEMGGLDCSLLPFLKSVILKHFIKSRKWFGLLIDWKARALGSILKSRLTMLNGSSLCVRFQKRMFGK